MNRTLELNWIRKQDKSLILPELIFDENPRCSGYYLVPEKREYLIGDKHILCDSGIIVICNFTDIRSTVAHEWRHHWQTCNGFKLDGGGWDRNTKNYEKSIYEYFIKSKSEMDALLFEYKHAKNDLNTYWMEIIFKNMNAVQAGNFLYAKTTTVFNN